MSKEGLFPLGQIVATPGAVDALEDAQEEVTAYIQKHVTGDWSEMSEEDQQENAFSVDKILRVFSSYTLLSGAVLWVITEADRSSTTVLLPEEY